IDISETLRFFQERGEKIEKVGSIGAVLYQDHNPDSAIQRHQAELERVSALLAPESGGRVLDIGCGTSRWAAALDDSLSRYLGLDFCQEFLDAGEASVASLKNPSRFAWRQWDFSKGALPAGQTFDLIIIAGVLLYLNDESVTTLIK